VDEHSMDHPFVETTNRWTTSPRTTEKTSMAVWWSRSSFVIVAIGVALYVAASHYQPLSQTSPGIRSQVLTSNGTLATNRITSASNVVWTERAGHSGSSDRHAQ